MISFLQQFISFFTDTANPTVRFLQLLLLAVGILAAFLVFFTTRDILLRTRSFLLQFLCILLVAALPIVGFLLYLLIRPTRTLKEREMEWMLQDILEAVLPPEEHKETSERSAEKAKKSQKQAKTKEKEADDAAL